MEVSGGGPKGCNTGLDRWLDEGGHNYVVAGDEYLGACFHGWEGPVEIPEGDFAYGYLGLKYYYPDINYAASDDQKGVSRLYAVGDDIISGELYDFLADSLLLNYDPVYELGNDNWLDGVDPVEDANVSYWGLTGILDDEGTPEIPDTLATGVYYELPNGSKTAFFGFDVLSLNTMATGADALHGAGYHWVGTYPQGPIPQALLWMNAITLDLNPSESIPTKFAINKIYPNPFNPTTSIEFSVPQAGVVTLTVFDLLGREMETLLNRRMDGGTHQIQWNASSVSSGIYFVRMQAGALRREGGLMQEFSQTQKVILIQ